MVLTCLLIFKEGAPEHHFHTLGPCPGRMSCGSHCKVDQLDCSIGRTVDARIGGPFGWLRFPEKDVIRSCLEGSHPRAKGEDRGFMEGKLALEHVHALIPGICEYFFFF